MFSTPPLGGKKKTVLVWSLFFFHFSLKVNGSGCSHSVIDEGV